MMLNDEIVERYRQRAIGELTDLIEYTQKYQFNAHLANDFYVFVLELMNEVDDVQETITLVEDVMSTFDHDLSDYLNLEEYKIQTDIEEVRDDPIVNVTLFHQGTAIFRIRLSVSESHLMMQKRKKSLQKRV